jgi:hypothetical protein
MCDVLLPPGVNPTVVKYIYHIKLVVSHSFFFTIGKQVTMLFLALDMVFDFMICSCRSVE